MRTGRDHLCSHGHGPAARQEEEFGEFHSGEKAWMASGMLTGGNRFGESQGQLSVTEESCLT